MLHRRHAVRAASILAVSALAATAASTAVGSTTSAYAASAPAAKCHVMPASAIPVAKLEASYRTLTHLAANTPLVAAQPQRYGACGSTYYAFDLFTVAKGAKLTSVQQIAQEDHSPIWSSAAGGRWVDAKLASLCTLAPPALVDLWAVGVRCDS